MPNPANTGSRLKGQLEIETPPLRIEAAAVAHELDTGEQQPCVLS
jgi:hypothetical protein